MHRQVHCEVLVKNINLKLLTGFLIILQVFIAQSCSNKKTSSISRDIARVPKKQIRSFERHKKERGKSKSSKNRKSSTEELYSVALEKKLEYLEQNGVSPIKMNWKKVLKEMDFSERAGFNVLVSKLYKYYKEDATTSASHLKLKVLKDYVGDVRGKKRREKIRELENKLCCLFGTCKSKAN